MSALKRLWTKIVQFDEMLQGAVDPTGDYILSLRDRVDKLERDMQHLERQIQSRAAGDDIR